MNRTQTALLALLLGLMSITTAGAQTIPEWAPIGAKWVYRDGCDGPTFEMESVAEVELLGKLMRQLEIRRYGRVVHEYVYQDGRKLFYLHTQDSSLHLLYDFSLSAGSRIDVHTAPFTPNEGYFAYPMIHSFFYEIDSVLPWDSTFISHLGFRITTNIEPYPTLMITGLTSMWSIGAYLFERIGSANFFFGGSIAVPAVDGAASEMNCLLSYTDSWLKFENFNLLSTRHPPSKDLLAPTVFYNSGEKNITVENCNGCYATVTNMVGQHLAQYDVLSNHAIFEILDYTTAPSVVVVSLIDHKSVFLFKKILLY